MTKTILITGATDGLGHATASSFLWFTKHSQAWFPLKTYCFVHRLSNLHAIETFGANPESYDG